MNEDGVDEFGSGTFLYSGAKSLYISPAMSSFNLRFDPVGMLEFESLGALQKKNLFCLVLTKPF